MRPSVSGRRPRVEVALPVGTRRLDGVPYSSSWLGSGVRHQDRVITLNDRRMGSARGLTVPRHFPKRLIQLSKYLANPSANQVTRRRATAPRRVRWSLHI